MSNQSFMCRVTEGLRTTHSRVYWRENPYMFLLFLDLEAECLLSYVLCRKSYDLTMICLVEACSDKTTVLISVLRKKLVCC